MDIGLREISGLITMLMTIIGFCAWINGQFKHYLRSVIEPMEKTIQKLEEEVYDLEHGLKHISNATSASMKYSISRAHREYMSSGEISRYALECVIDMYDQYAALGGSDLVKEFVVELEKLPLKM